MAEGTCSVEGCARPVSVQQAAMCSLHYNRSRRGIPLSAPFQFHAKGTPEERLYQRIRIVPDGCWEWLGNRLPRGYGQISVKENGRWTMRYAHRVSYEVHHGPIPEGLYVLHSCDNPPCVNPDHLRIGSAAENMAEMKERGRSGRVMTADWVRAIRGSVDSTADLARFFGCHWSSIASIRKGRNWSWVE